MTEEIVFTLEDNKEYVLVKQIELNKINYLFLVQVDDNDNFVIRKKINDKLIGLDNEKELKDILTIYSIDYLKK